MQNEQMNSIQLINKIFNNDPDGYEKRMRPRARERSYKKVSSKKLLKFITMNVMSNFKV